ncbi:MAG: crossover junction endodeoxyribonuclease RuvC [Hyphomicrobiales bacterium]
MRATVRIIGIDPGLRRTGWGILDCEGTRLAYVADGVAISDETRSLAERLVQLHDQLAAVIADWHPDEAAVEETFVNRDARATLKLGQARGIALMVPSAAGLSVAEYAPNMVKKSVVGTGHAEKDQIRHMIGVLLPKARPGNADAADALAIAICHAHHRISLGRRAAWSS